MMKVVLFAFIFSVSLVVSAQPTPTQVHAAVKQAGGVERFLFEMARQTAQSLPQMTNQNLQVQSVTANGRRISYTAVLLNIERRLGQDVEKLKRQSISYLACSSPVLGVVIKQYDAEIIYFYTARNTELLFQHALNRTSCDGH